VGIERDLTSFQRLDFLGVLNVKLREGTDRAKLNATRFCHFAMSALIGLTLSSLIVVAQSVKVEGIIKARDGDTMILKTSSSPDITVLLADSTRVGQVQVCSG
jgi:hypothetical protein